MVLEPIYEHEFHDFSHGFRKGRNQHNALRRLRENLITHKTKWIVIADITGLFDNLDHEILKELIRKRVNDGRIIQLIGKWLNAGVMEEGRLQHTEAGTLQGGVISPLLSNIFLHYVLDDWYVKEVQPRMKGKSFLIRWADDFIIAFEDKTDAERVMKVLPERFRKYKLNLHPDKTNMIYFANPNSDKDNRKRGTFDFLGFTYYWGRGLNVSWAIKKRTARKREARFMKRIYQYCKEHMHDPINEQYDALCLKLRGFYQYFGVRSNYAALEKVRKYTLKVWQKWLSRRSSKGEVLFDELKVNYPLPLPRIVHNV